MLKIQNDTIVNILWKQIQGDQTTTEEGKILEEWCSSSEYNQNIFDQISGKEQWENDLKLSLDQDEKTIWNKILPVIQESEQVAEVVHMRKPWYNYAVAAALIGVTLYAGTYFFMSNGSYKETTKTTTAQQKKGESRQDERAFLKLSDGSTIYLDEAENGRLALEGNSEIKKLNDGELVYDAANKNIAANQLPLTFNTLSTPRGAQYKLVLQDGSKIWLNAASSLRFPSSLSDGERVVELTGEAYFEVAPSRLSGQSGQNHPSPFLVKANGISVEVLGTHFNVMAYKDEPVTMTTLLEGAVKVKTDADARLLKPGQQARVANPAVLPAKSTAQISVIKEGLNDAIAWKKGYLDFHSADITSVMRQISRSYKIDVIYKGTPQGEFSGRINIKTTISEVINALELSGINATLMNGKIVIAS